MSKCASRRSRPGTTRKAPSPTRWLTAIAEIRCWPKWVLTGSTSTTSKPNPNNSYTITDEDVNNLAGLIWNSKEVEPLILRETEDGIQIIDGERRWRACKLLAEKVWRRMADGSGQMPQAWCRFRRTSQFHHALEQYRPAKHQAIGTRTGLQGASGQAGGMAQG